MKRVGKPWFFVVAIIIIVLSYLTFFGVYGSYGDMQTTIIRGVKDIRWGTDIQGGVTVTFGPLDAYDASETELNAASNILETRLINDNVTDYELYVDSGSDRIIVSFPWKDNQQQDVASTIDELSATAVLLFIEGAPNDIAYVDPNYEFVMDSNGTSYPIGIQGKHIDSAEVLLREDTNERFISLDFTKFNSEQALEA